MNLNVGYGGVATSYKQRCQTADCSLSHTSGYFQRHLGTFPDIKQLFFTGSWTVPSVIEATKIGI